MAYTEEYLLEKLNELWQKYGTIQTKLIDSEPNFPTRKCYVRAFGSLENACNIIGYKNYHKNTFNIKDAQKKIDERNGHFTLLNFYGMGNKCSVQCKECGTIYEITPDSLIRNKTNEHFGCKECNSKNYKNKIAVENVNDEHVKLSIKEIEERYPRKNGYGYIYEIYNLINNKRYIGSTVNPSHRWKEHIWAAFSDSNQSYNYPLQSALRKYGVDNFVFNIICINVPIENLANKEKEMIIKYNTITNTGWGYNQTIETECSLRDNLIKSKGMRCALIDDDDNILEIFDSYHEASRMLFNNENSATKICAVCNERLKTYKKMKFIKLEGSD